MALQDDGEGAVQTLVEGLYESKDVRNPAAEFVNKLERFGVSIQSLMELFTKTFDEVPRDFILESSMLAQAHGHPHVVRLFAVVPDAPNGSLGLVTEFMAKGSLKDVMASRSLGRHDILMVAIGVADGMAHIHSRGLVHHDIKLENILVTMSRRGNLFCKISDFGLSQKIGTSVSSTPGTLGYMAPEICSRDSPLIASPEADVYSFGVLMARIADKIMENDYGWNELMRGCKSRRPADRPRSTEILAILKDIATTI